jgi:hypothetical protein
LLFNFALEYAIRKLICLDEKRNGTNGGVEERAACHPFGDWGKKNDENVFNVHVVTL